MSPADTVSTFNVAEDLLAKGRTCEAIAKYEALLANTAFVEALLPQMQSNLHSNLGTAFLSLGNIEQARDHYQVALRLNPDDQAARSGLQKIEALSSE